MDDLQSRDIVILPLERLSKWFRLRQKMVEKELFDVLTEATSLPDEGCSVAELQRLLNKVDTLSAQANAYMAGERAAIGLLQFRLRYLQGKSRPPFQLNVAIAGYLLREGYIDAARRFVSALSTTESALIDHEQFEELHAARRLLRDAGGNVTCASEWAHAHSSRLRRIGSPLEFLLRKQEFLALIQRGDTAAALSFASNHLAPSAQLALRFSNPASDAPSSINPMAELQAAMSALAFANPASCGVAEVERLFQPAARERIAHIFHLDALHAIGCARHSPLELMLLVGAAALRTPSCHAHDSIRSGSGGKDVFLVPRCSEVACPLCYPHLFTAALQHVPMLQRSVSRLRCPITQQVLDERNQPVALPNGRVFSAKVMELLCSEDKSLVVCPVTNDVFPRTAIRKVFVM